MAAEKPADSTPSALGDEQALQQMSRLEGAMAALAVDKAVKVAVQSDSTVERFMQYNMPFLLTWADYIATDPVRAKNSEEPYAALMLKLEDDFVSGATFLTERKLRKFIKAHKMTQYRMRDAGYPYSFAFLIRYGPYVRAFELDRCKPLETEKEVDGVVCKGRTLVPLQPVAAIMDNAIKYLVCPSELRKMDKDKSVRFSSKDKVVADGKDPRDILKNVEQLHPFRNYEDWAKLILASDERKARLKAESKKMLK
jgi:hypothetical protein